jgi:hypothetical protein
MRRMMGRGALLAAVVVLAIGAVLLQTASSQVTGQTLNLNFPDSEPDSFTGSGAPSIGDVFSFKGAITDESDADVGHVFATASVFTKSPLRVQMTATVTLDSGSLNFIGELTFDTADQGTLSVVGGTGAYDGALGSAVITGDPDTGYVNIDITLLP